MNIAPPRHMFSAFRHRNYRLWAAADFVSVTGTWMQVLGVNWYVLQVTGSAAHMGVSVLMQALPVLLLGSWGGALADRLPGRPVLIATQATHALLAAALALIVAAPSPTLLPVYAISLLSGLVSVIEGPVLGRFAATVVDRVTLSNAVSLGSIVNSSGRILGMSAGGLAVAVAGPAPLFAANAVSFLAVIGALLALRTDRLHPLDDPAPGGRRLGGGVRAGFAYLLRQPLVLITLGLAMVLGSLGRNYQVTMAAMSDGPLAAGAGGYGLLSSAFAVGTVLGGLVAASRPSLCYRTLIGAGLLTSVLQTTAGIAPGLWTFAAAIVPIAAGAVLIDTTVATRVQLDTHGEMRGRVLAAAAMASAAAGAIGAPLLGWLSEWAGPRQTLVFAGIVTALTCVAAGTAIARRRGVPVRARELRLALAVTLGR
ncbi:MAG: MFS transporter [Hamadaea sp.]|nr:MFS transporter [Hamadaea sp.]